ncbi:ankyrin repeat-containing domain protein [Coprinopsis sp. MPI-PUGE-AT-0042]|nr:ankyrin repeat-containing domain protein [Coprinopsis sp. MPI-PUGE-AT-0042]
MFAVLEGKTETVTQILNTPGIDINAKDKRGWTALMHAAHFTCADVMKPLLEVPGIDINTVSIDGDTALSLASRYGDEEMVELLLASLGAVPGSPDSL